MQERCEENEEKSAHRKIYVILSFGHACHPLSPHVSIYLQVCSHCRSTNCDESHKSRQHSSYGYILSIFQFEMRQDTDAEIIHNSNHPGTGPKLEQTTTLSDQFNTQVSYVDSLSFFSEKCHTRGASLERPSLAFDH